MWAFGVRLGASVNLNELPIVGSKPPPDQTLAIQNLQILYSSADMTSAQTGIINPLLLSGVADRRTRSARASSSTSTSSSARSPSTCRRVSPAAAVPAGSAAGAVVPASSTDP